MKQYYGLQRKIHYLINAWLCSTLLCFTIFSTYGQGFSFSAGLEKTATRCLYGGVLTFENQRKWGIGAFYQASILNESEEGIGVNNVFYGIAFQLPLAKTDKIDFFATARVGFVNRNFLVVVPSLETRIKTWRKLSTVFGMGYRVGYPSIGIKFSHPIM